MQTQQFKVRPLFGFGFGRTVDGKRSFHIHVLWLVFLIEFRLCEPEFTIGYQPKFVMMMDELGPLLWSRAVFLHLLLFRVFFSWHNKPSAWHYLP